MPVIPRSQGQRALGAVAVFFALLLLYSFANSGAIGSFSNLPVIYVDSQTGKVIRNFDAERLPLSNPEQVLPKGSTDKPIKNSANEQKAGLQQIDNQQKGSRPQDFVYPGKRVKATFVSLARNSELYDLVEAIRHVEDRFNRKFRYDWVFLNDEPFTEEFKNVASSIVSGEAKFGLVPKEHWSYPDWIDQKKAAKTREDMKNAKIIYGDLESYRHMCRYESGFFFRHPLMEEYDWYWRVEPGIKIHCDLEYDLFKYMEDNDKVYGFTISLREYEATIPTLWRHTKDFLKLHPEYKAKDNFMNFISDDHGATFNLCHFWSNFEVALTKFFKSKAYLDYFEYLDKQGGFFYERWGDAPIHSIAVSLFLSKDKIHYFEDVGYKHGPYTQCPLNDEFRYKNKCSCHPTLDFTFRGYSCGRQYYDAMGLEKPKEWIHYTD